MLSMSGFGLVIAERTSDMCRARIKCLRVFDGDEFGRLPFRAKGLTRSCLGCCD